MNPFLSECGLDEPLRLGVSRPESPAIEPTSFEAPFALIGRDPALDLSLPHAEVSERHAYVQVVDGRPFCVDLGSRRGTSIAGRRRRWAWVGREETIRIGPYRIRTIGTDDPAKPDSAPPASEDGDWPGATTAGAPVTLELSHRSVRSSRCPLPSRLVLVGSAVDCQVRLLDPSASNYHCSLVRTDSGLWVVNLLGRDGTFVNGTPVRFARLDDGDVVRLGRSEIRIHLGSPPVPDATIHAPGCLPGHDKQPPAPPPSVPPVIERAIATPTAADPPAPVESASEDLACQFDALQRQLVDQFHQTGLMLFETFSTLHEEQAAMIRDELSRLRGITRQLETLTATLAGAAALPAPPRMDLDPGPENGRRRFDEGRIERPHAGRDLALVHPPCPSSSGRDHAVPHDPMSNGQPGDPALENPLPNRRREADAHVHNLLHRRIAAIKGESRRGWPKIFGGRGDPTAPVSDG
jgi:pSer/pThr/pTyr-binding forkhead associated (FHA) protein